MEPQHGQGEQERGPHGGGQRGAQGPAVVHQPEGDHLHLEAVLGGHAAEHALLQRRVHHRAQHAEVPGEDAGVVPRAVVLLPAVGGVEGAHGAGEEDRGVGLHQDLPGRGATQLQSCRDRAAGYIISHHLTSHYIRLHHI